MAHVPQRVWRQRKKLAALARAFASQPPTHDAEPNTPVNPWVAASVAANAKKAADEAYLWPCNVQAWACWVGVQTQWRTGMAGREGLHYPGVHAWLDEATDLRGDERREVFRGICAAESAVLQVWAEQRQNQQGA